MTSKTTSKTSTTIQGEGNLVRRWNQANHGLVVQQVEDLRVHQLAWLPQARMMANQVIKMVNRAFAELGDGQQGWVKNAIGTTKVVINRINREEDYLVTIVYQDDRFLDVDLNEVWERIDREEEEFGDILLSRIGGKATYLHRG